MEKSKLRRQIAIQKVHSAIELHGGTTILSTGITGDDARLALAAVEAGARLLEPNHPGVALSRGHQGVRTMNEAEEVRHEITVEEMANVVQGVRNVVGEEIFITVAAPGAFEEKSSVVLSEKDIILLADAGTDGLHIHKASFQSLKEIVDRAHKHGLTVDAYITHPDDTHRFGIPAGTADEVACVAEKMQEIGVDMIGLMLGMSYQGKLAGEVDEDVISRLGALVGAVDVPTLAEGGINFQNASPIAATGVDIIVVGTAIDDKVRESVKEGIRTLLNSTS